MDMNTERSRKELNVILQEFCDESMRDFVRSEQFADEQDEIIGMITDLRSSLSPEQKRFLNQLIDKINDSDSRFTYEAFKQGFLMGMASWQI